MKKCLPVFSDDLQTIRAYAGLKRVGLFGPLQQAAVEARPGVPIPGEVSFRVEEYRPACGCARFICLMDLPSCRSACFHMRPSGLGSHAMTGFLWKITCIYDGHLS